MAKSKPQTKSAQVITLLMRGKGATLKEIGKDTSWQPHSVRAFLTGLRKKGFVPAGYWGKPNDLTGEAVFLASPASDYLPGTMLAADRRWLAG